MIIIDNVKARLSTSAGKLVDGEASSVARDAGVQVHTFSELQDMVAEASYYNSRFDIFLRGQGTDHRDARGHSALEATLFRTKTSNPVAEVTAHIGRLERHSETLRAAARYQPGFKGVQTTEFARWCLLQHYEACPTPLLDMTRSVRVAASFATWPMDGDLERDRYVYVLGLPHPSGSVTIAYNDNIALMNLRNLMPPTARRPHWQEGYLACAYPSSTHWDMHFRDKKTGKDVPRRHNFARRLLAKFVIPSASLPTFGDHTNPRVPNDMLMPPKDPVRDFIRAKLGEA